MRVTMRAARAMLRGIVRLTLLASCPAALLAAADSGSAASSLSASDAGAAGRVAYAAHCQSCHGAGLSGGGSPALKGPAFQARWLTRDSSNDLDRALRRMPPGAPDSLSQRDYDAIKSYILSANADPGTRTAAPSAGISRKLPAAPDNVAYASAATPTVAELLAPADGDWPMYNRTYQGQRFSPLAQITAANANRLEVACIVQMGEPGSFMASPVIYKGTGYVTTRYSVVAFNAATCEKRWTYTYTPKDREPLTGNRGVALYRGAIYRGTTDGHLLAIDAVTGKLLWDAHVVDSKGGNFVGVAPIVFRGKVIVGLAGGDFGGVGHVYAFDATTGKLAWTFNSIPTGSEPGAETWKKGIEYGGAATWTSFAADPKDRLVLAPIGNPAPDFVADARPGDNLYSNSVVALDAETGKIAWHVQQLPADVHDYDTAAPPVLYEQDGRRFLSVGSKNGYVYLYDRDTRALLNKAPVTTIRNSEVPLSADRSLHVCPGFGGGVQWYGPAYSPMTKSMFVGSVDWCGEYILDEELAPHTPGDAYMGGSFKFGPRSEQSGWLTALDGATGRKLWSYHAPAPMIGGVTPTAGGVVLTGGANGEFLVFDARDGRVLYRFQTGGSVGGGVSTYEVAGRQYVAVASGHRSGLAFGQPGLPIVVVFRLRH